MLDTLGISFAIGAVLSPTVAHAFSTVDKKIQASTQSLEKLTAKSTELKNVSEAYSRREASAQLNAAANFKDSGIKAQYHKDNAVYHEAAAAAAKYKVAIDAYATAHADAEKQMAREQNRLERLQKAKTQQKDGKAAISRSKTAFSGLKATFVPLRTLGLPITAAIDFESVMANATNTIDGMRDSSGNLTPKYYEMETAIKKMGREIPLTHAQIAGLFSAGGQQGMTGVDELQEFTTMAAHMSSAFGMSTEEAADAIGGYRSAMRLSLPEARSMLDLMNQYANTSSATEKGIADVVSRIGPLGNVGGIAAKPMTALAATLDSMKVAPDVAATGIKNMILAMTAGSAATKTQQEAFASLGIDSVQLAKDMQENGPAAITNVLEKIKALPKDQQLSIMQQIFGKESLGAIAPLLDSLDVVKTNLTMAGDASAYAGSMQAEFEKRNKTTAAALIMAKNKVAELGITVGSVMLPMLVSFLDKVGPVITTVTDFAGAHQNLTAGVLTAVGGIIAMYAAGQGLFSLFSFGSGIIHMVRAAAFLLSPGMRMAAAATRVLTLATRAWAVATRVAAFGMQVLRAAFLASPIGRIVAGVAAVAYGLYLLYQHCEPVRAAFDTVFSFIGDKLAWLADKWQTVKSWLGMADETDASIDAKITETKTVETKTVASATTAPPAPAMMPPSVANTAVPPANASAAHISQKPESRTASTSAASAPRTSNSPASPLTPTTSFGSPAPGVAVSMNFNISGITDSGFTQRLMDALRNNSTQFERIIADIVHNQGRRAYA